MAVSDTRSRRPTDPRKTAEAAFRAATARKPEGPAAPAVTAPPGVRENVTLRLDAAVLEYFQKDGPGWQDRINEALKGLIAR